MKKHRPRIRKTKQRNRKPQTTIVGTPNNGEPVVYHGGAPFLKVGEYILPRSITGAQGWRQMARHAEERMLGEDSPLLEDGDWAFITENFKLAVFYAVRRTGRGCVYRVEPEGRLETDPDRPLDCFRCERARIVGVEKIPFDLAQKMKAKTSQLHHHLMFGGNGTKTVRDWCALVD